MATKTIPMSYLHVCDGCGAEKDSPYQRRPSNWCNLSVGRDAIDFQGQAVGDASITRLLCSDCCSAVISAINSSLASRMRATA
jgi:hypothetical protein